MQSFSCFGPCLRGNNGLGKSVKDQREEDRGGKGRGILYGQGERQDRRCLSCVLEALQSQGLKQLYPSLGWRFQVTGRGRRALEWSTRTMRDGCPGRVLMVRSHSYPHLICRTLCKIKIPRRRRRELTLSPRSHTR